MKIIQTKALPSTKWSGGTTTELFVYPEGSAFAKGNFQLRISLATVEQENSIFTSLPNTNRTLLVLQGRQLLAHRGHHSADLSAFQQDSFSGNWTTDCQGQSINFNVMTRGEVKATVTTQNYLVDTLVVLDSPDTLQFIYLIHGAIEFLDHLVTSKHAIAFTSPAKLTVKKDTRMILVSYPLNSDS